MQLDWLALIIAVLGSSAVSGVILYFLNSRVTKTGIDKSQAEIKKIEHDLEAQYIKQLEQWLVDLQHIKEKHEGEITQKDEEIVSLHKQYLNTLKDLAEHKFQISKFNQSVRRLLIELEIAYWECDEKGLLTYANGTWLKRHGLTLEEALGHGWQQAIPVENRKAVLLHWNTAIVDQNEDEIDAVVTNTITGETFPIKAVYSIIKDTAGNIVKIIGVTIKV